MQTSDRPSTPAGEAATRRRGLTSPSHGFSPDTFLSDVVLAMELADAERVESALQAARNPGMMLESVLTETGVLTEDELARALSERHGVPHVDLSTFQLDPAAVGLVSAAFAKRYAALPVGFTGDGALLVAMADPGDWLAIEEISRLTGYEVSRAAAARPSVEALADHAPPRDVSSRRTASAAATAAAFASSLKAEEATLEVSEGQERDAIVAAAPATPPPTHADEPPGGVVDAGFEAFQRWMLEQWVAEREQRLVSERAELERERDRLERERVALERQSAALNQTLAA